MEYHHPFRAFMRQSLNRIRYGKRLGPLFGNLQWFDDFDWTNYTQDSYRQEMITNRTTRLAEVKWSIRDGHIIVPEDRPLHPMHRIIYETALELNPNSIFEAGCGGGDHLANLRLLLPSAQLEGGDVSREQMNFARERNFSDNSILLRELDLTQPGVSDGIQAEFVYTNSVLMHLHGGERPVQFVKNLWSISTCYVLFVENWTRHNFLKLFEQGIHGQQAYKIERDGAVGVLFTRQKSMDLPPLNRQSDLFKTKESKH